MKHKSLKNDLLAGDIIKFRKLESAFLDRCRQFGYEEIKTSTIEPLYIFTALGALSDQKLRRMYSFIDWDGWSGERVALKPDSTTCVARFYGDHLMEDDLRQKLCYVENHFEWADSWDEISERWQFGIENIGNSASESDIEAIYIAIDALKAAGLKDFHLFLSYPAVIMEIIRFFDLDEADEKKLLDVIKEGRKEAVFKTCEEMKISPASQEILELFFSMSESFEGSGDFTAGYLENLKTALPANIREKTDPGLDNFISIAKRLDSLGLKYKIDFSMIGDLKYYTGLMFEILASNRRRSRKDIFCSGGRYDHLIGKMWECKEPIPAVGFALFVRNIIKYVPTLSDKLQNIAVYIENITGINVKTGQNLSNRLSALGFDARITFSKVKPEDYDSYGLVLEVDHDSFDNGFKVLFSQKIGKPLLINLFGEFNDR